MLFGALYKSNRLCNLFSSFVHILKKDNVSTQKRYIKMLGSDIYSLQNIDSCLHDSWRNTEKSYKTVAVEGNIGCGKTTFLNYFKSKSCIAILPEPVDKWKSIDGYNCLDMMYKDPVRWSMPFQSYLTLTMLDNHERKEKQWLVKMMERSVHSARHCFIRNLHQNGLMSDVEYFVIGEWHDWISSNADTGVDLIVYLRASPETCQERIKIRSRSEESEVSLDYLHDLHNLHEEWLVHEKRGPLPAPVLIIDADVSLDEIKQKIEELTPEICQK